MKINQIDLDTKVQYSMLYVYFRTKVRKYEARDTWDSRRGGRALGLVTATCTVHVHAILVKFRRLKLFPYL